MNTGSAGEEYLVPAMTAGDQIRYVETASKDGATVTGTSNVLTYPVSGSRSDPYFAMTGNGRWWLDPSSVPSNTKRITYRFRVRVPASVPQTSSTDYVATQVANGFDIRLLLATGGTENIYITALENRSWVSTRPSNNTLWIVTRDELVTIEVYADQGAKEVGFSIDGGAFAVRAMVGGALGNTFQSSRAIGLLSRNGANDELPSGVQMSFAEVHDMTNGVKTLRKRIDATNVNIVSLGMGGTNLAIAA